MMFSCVYFRDPKKKLLKFLSNLKAVKNSDSLIKLSGKGTASEVPAIAEEIIPADSGVAGLKSRDDSGNNALKLFT
jgi:hypothetical protein